MTTFFTADQHFWHERIIEYCHRPFKNARHMNDVIIQKYREKVKEEDEVYFIGDLTLAGPDNRFNIEKLLDKLPGKKHLILGNHDRLDPFDYVKIGFNTVHTALDFPQDNVSLCHDPAVHCAIPDNRYLYCGHVHSLFKICKRVINVGVDVWDYFPVSSTQLYDLIYQEVVSREQMGWLKEKNYTE
jgi:calcineurin-like phosphoesterase family protein